MCTWTEYGAKFDELIAELNGLTLQVAPKMYQMKLSNLSSKATDFYHNNANPNQNDYQNRIDMFLDFDHLLKKHRRDQREHWMKMEARVPASSGFFSRVDLLDIAQPDKDPRSPASSTSFS